MDAWQWFGFLTILILFSFCKSVLFRYWLHKEDRSYNDGYDDGFDRGYEDGQESVMDQTGIDDDVPSEITLDRNGRPNGVTEPFPTPDDLYKKPGSYSNYPMDGHNA
jgi:hypothetical protein